jgi:4-diphosphocytidyl-2-C-methyl-D-erythritol kinase
VSPLSQQPFIKVARAKINLYLDILQRRPDRFHDLKTLFVELDLADRLEFQLLSSTKQPQSNLPLGRFTVSGPYAQGVPTDQTNLVCRALEVLEKAVGHPLPSMALHLEKNIPHGAGLGGGSSDAAAALVAVNQLCELGLSCEKLTELAATLGSDCAFFIRGGAAEASGRGEVLTPVPLVRSFHVLLAWPRFGISTAKAYGALSSEMLGPHTDGDLVRRWIGGEDVVLPKLHNSFEKALLPEYPILQENLEIMRSCGASNVLLSGSGSAVFGIFEDKGLLQKALSRLKGGNDCFACRAVGER